MFAYAAAPRSARERNSRLLHPQHDAVTAFSLIAYEIGNATRRGENAVKLLTFEVAARIASRVGTSPPDATLTSPPQAEQLRRKGPSDGHAHPACSRPKGATFVRRFLEADLHAGSRRLVKGHDALHRVERIGLQVAGAVKGKPENSSTMCSRARTAARRCSRRHGFGKKDWARFYGATSSDAAFSPLTLTK